MRLLVYRLDGSLISKLVILLLACNCALCFIEQKQIEVVGDKSFRDKLIAHPRVYLQIQSYSCPSATLVLLPSLG